MKDKDKTKERLIEEIGELRQCVAELERLQKPRKQTKKKPEEYPEELYRSLFENSPDAVIVTDMKGTITLSNPAMSKMSGYLPPDYVGKHFTKLPVIQSREIPKYIKYFSYLARGKVAPPFETTFRHMDGTMHSVEIYSALIKSGHKRLGSQVIVRDITEHKQVEEEVARFKKIADIANYGVCICDLKRTFIYVNECYAQMHGYAVDELVGQHFPILYPEWEWDHALQMFNQLKKRGEIENEEVWHKRKDGSVFPSLMNSTTLRDDTGKPNLLFAITVDITERKRAEEELRESEEKLRLMFESVADGIVVTDLNGIIIDANERAAELRGVDSKYELLGQSPISFNAPRDRDRAAQNMRRAIEENLAEVHEYTCLKVNGSEFPGEINSSVLIDTNGNPSGIIAVIRDITEQKVLEEERQKSERLESVGTLAGGIAHDFNNLLTGITGYIGLAMRNVELGQAEKAYDMLTKAEDASLQARDLTHQLLTFARGGAPVKKVISINQLIRDSATFALRGSNVRCGFSLPDDLWSVEVDEGQINQVISNLVINADEAMPDGGIVNIRTKNTVIEARSTLPLAKGKYVEIIVEDHGIGISEEHLGRIFDPYFTTKQKGSGLGLATAYSIAKNHGGCITVQSKLGVETTFHIYLPASKRPAPKKEEVVAEAPITGGGRVLVMDDQDMIRQFLFHELTEVGYDVELSGDGAEAIEKYKQAEESGHPFDVVILDLTVPGGMGGKQTIEKLLEIDPEVKAIVSSGYSTAPVMSDFREYGFKGVVAKPFRIGELEKIMRNVIRAKKSDRF